MLSENVRDIVERIRPHMQRLVLRKNKKLKKDQVLREAMRENVLVSANHLRHASRILEKMVRNKELMVVGAEYDIETGVVDFFDIPLSKM